MAGMGGTALYSYCRYVLVCDMTRLINRRGLRDLVIIVTVAVGIEDRPDAAPETAGPWVSDWKVVGQPSFAQGIAAVSNLLFAFSGTPGRFKTKYLNQLV